MLVYEIMKNSLLAMGGACVGILLVLFLPYAWIFAGIAQFGKLAVKGAVSLADRSSSFEWRPLQSYFTGRKEKRRRK